MEWYYETPSGRKGPVNIENLQKLFIDGKIDHNTLVWKTGMQNWIPIIQCIEIFDLDKPKDKQITIENEERVNCPYCAEKIKIEATVCPFCKQAIFSKDKTKNAFLYIISFIVLFFLFYYAITAFVRHESKDEYRRIMNEAEQDTQHLMEKASRDADRLMREYSK